MTRVSFALLMLAVCSVGAAETPFDTAAQIYLSELERNGQPVFFTSCSGRTGTAVLVFGLGHTDGQLFEFRDSSVVNRASVALKTGSLAIDIENTQGGVYTYTVMQHHAETLSHLPFTFTLPRDLGRILKLRTTHSCPDRPPA